MRKQTKIAALVSAAALLAIGASMTALAQPGWNIDAASGTATYHDRYDDVETDVWHTWTDGKYYYFGSDGYMVRSQLVDYNNKLYYVDSTGAKVTNQWVRLDNEYGDTVGNNEVSYIYYFFDNNGQAKKDGAATVRKNNSTDETAKFVFDSEGRMLSGWQTLSDGSIYYLGDETNGMAVTGWQKMEPKADFADPYDRDLVWYYFGTDGKQVTNSRRYLDDGNGKKYWFVFDNTDGRLVESDWSSIGIATENYAGAVVKGYYKDGGYQTAGWVQADYDGSGSAHETKWFYLDSKGVPFNYDMTVATGSEAGASKAVAWNTEKGDWDTKTLTNVAAKVIKNKTYLFNEYGEMLSGVYKLTNVYRQGSPNKLGVTAVTGGDAPEAKIYYFDTEAATEGAMAQNKKVSVTKNDVTYNYSVNSNGEAAEDAIVNGTLYGENGVRVDSDTGTWMVYTIPEKRTIVSDKKSKADATKYAELTAGTRIIVNTNGRVKESGTVIIDGIKYWVKDVSTSDLNGEKTEGTIGESYVVVYSKPID